MSSESCRVYWRTHGCHLPRGHAGPHTCHPVEFMHHEDDDWDLCENDHPLIGDLLYGEDAPVGWVGKR